jgi:hypothetical protein
MCRDQKVQVEVARRCGRKHGRVAGAIVALNEEEIEAAIVEAKVVKSEAPGPAAIVARCAYPLPILYPCRGARERRLGSPLLET